MDQAKEIGEKLKEINFDKVFSSPLKRTIETAKLIIDKKIEVDERLIERFSGNLEGKVREEYKDIFDFKSKGANKFAVEKLEDFKTRIYDFFKEISQKYHSKNILVLTHGGVSIFAKCFFEGEPKDENYKGYRLRNCEYFKYEN